MAGAKRRFNPKIPAHIDQSALPKGVYFDSSGQGRWYMFITQNGQRRRRTLAGPWVTLSQLHRLLQQIQTAQDRTHGTVRWALQAFADSSKFSTFSDSTQRDYRYCRKAIETFPTRDGRFVGDLHIHRLTATHMFKLLESVAKKTPSKANHMLRYVRRALRWAQPGLGLTHNPAWGLEAFAERKRRRLPNPTVYNAVLSVAKESGRRPAHSRGSLPPYVWMVLELAYLCRLRGIETLTLVQAQGTAEGVYTQRRKGSRNNVVRWTPRLRTVWHAALAHAERMRMRHGVAPPRDPHQRYLFLSEDGSPLSKSGLDSAFQRLMHRAIDTGVIAAHQRFGLHDLKRKGITDTPGTKAEKQEAAGLTEAMMTVYDFSVPHVPPASD